MICGVKDAGAVSFNRTLLLSFANCINVPEYLVVFNAGFFILNDILDWVHHGTAAATRAVAAGLTEKPERGFGLFKTRFGANGGRV